MDAELRAKAEWLAFDIYPHDPAGMAERERDVRAVVVALLTANPADDGEPVTEEWLRAVGFEVRCEWELVLPLSTTGRPTQWRLVFNREPQPGHGNWELGFPGCHSLLGYDLPTRGQVRLLARALGLPLKEGA